MPYKIKQNTKAMLLGFFLAFVAAFLYPVIYGCVKESFNNTLFSTVIAYSDTKTNVPFLDKILIQFLIILNRLFSEIFQSNNTIIILVLLFFALSLSFYKKYSEKKSENEQRLFLGILLWLIIDISGLTLIGRFYTHYLIQLIPVIIFIILYPLSSVNKAVKISVVCLITITCFYQSIMKYSNQMKGNYSYPVEVVHSKKIANYIRKQTLPSEKIFLYREKSLDIFYLSERLSCNGIYMFIVMDAEHTNNKRIEKEKTLLFEKNLPEIIVYGDYIPPRTSKKAETFFNKIIKNKYSLINKIDGSKIYKKTNI